LLLLRIILPLLVGASVSLTQVSPVPAPNLAIDVTGPPYNADKTGAINAAGPINSAISAASDREVLFRCGTYTITSPLMLHNISNVRLHAEAPGCATISYNSVAFSGFQIYANRGETTQFIEIDGLRFDNAARSDIRVAGRGSLYIGNNAKPGTSGIVSDVFVTRMSVARTGTCGIVVADASNVFLDAIRVEQSGEHGIYISGAQRVYGSNIEIDNPCGQGGTIAGCAGLKIGTVLSGVVNVSNITVRAGSSPHVHAFLLQNAAHMTVVEPRVVLGGPSQIGFRIQSNHAFINRPSVDGGIGYAGASAFFIDGGTDAVVNGGVITGAWRSSPVQLRTGANSPHIHGLTVESILIGPTYAVLMTGPISPFLDDVRIMHAEYGVNLGTSEGTELTNLVNNATRLKYKTTNARGYHITEER
jgi:hypothetical protein